MEDELFANVPSCPPPFDSHHIGAEMRMISNMIHRAINRCCVGDEDAVTGTNNWILGYLACNEDRDVFQRDLEEIFNVRRATVSKIICLMEQKGLIERESVAHDARLKKLVLTEKGRRLHKEKIAEFDRMEESFKKNIPPEKLETFFEVCNMIKKNISEMNMREEKQT